MPRSPLTPVARFVRDLARSDGGARSDRELLEQFARDHDQEAFAALVERHGPLVLGVCRRVLRHEQDAQDAFQATFLVLAKKAGVVAWQDGVGNWLHGVASRVAMKARAGRATRERHERHAAELADDVAPVPPPPDDLKSVLDEEIGRLPAHYRTAVVLCCLEGLTQDEAARRAGWSAGALRGRVNRGRELLRERLRRRGIELGVGLPGLLEVVPAAMKTATCLLGGSHPTGLSPAVSRLADEVLATMTKHSLFKTAAVALLVAALAGTALASLPGGALRHHTAEGPAEGEKPAEAPAGPLDVVRGKLHAVKAGAVVVDLEAEDPVRIAFPVAADAKVTLARGKAALADLKPGTQVALRLDADHRTVVAVRGHGKTVEGSVVGLGKDNTLTLMDDDDDDGKGEKLFPLAPGARFLVNGYPLEASQVEPKMHATAELSADGKQIVEVHLSWPNEGTLKSELVKADADARTITVEEEDKEVALELTRDARVLFEGQPAKLAELKAGCHVLVRFAEKDARKVALVWAQTRDARRPSDF